MNRIILIGNGFDLAHGLPTRYEDFINWYLEQRLQGFAKNKTCVDSDALFSLKIEKGFSLGEGTIIDSCSDYFQYFKAQLEDVSLPSLFLELVDGDELCVGSMSLFFRNICHSIETKKWVDIENEYYRLLIQCVVENKSIGCTVRDLNKQLSCLQAYLVKYLYRCMKYADKNENIKDFIYEPIQANDVAVEGWGKLVEYFQYWLGQEENIWKEKMQDYEFDKKEIKDALGWRRDLIEYENNKAQEESDIDTLTRYNGYFPHTGIFPDNILFLNFNYTVNAEQYFIRNKARFKFNYIHRRLDNANGIIFGYGDELDERYNKLLEQNDNECLRYVKSFKYLESSDYRSVLSFIEKAPYQVYIMGHSCGNSDRTLLNTLFEHRNCVTVKPFYHQKDDGTDNYLDLVQNISRNFTSMKLMRDRVVNKTFCRPMTQSKKK